MNVEISRRIANPFMPSPVLKEVITMQGDSGIFEVFKGLPITHGFQWNNPGNVAYTREPGYPHQDALKVVRGRVVAFLNSLEMNGDAGVLAHAVPGHTGIIDIIDTSLLEDHGIQGLFTREGNAFFTTIPGLPLYSTMRDCTQTIFYAEREGQSPVVGLIHSGRTEADARFPLTAVQHAIETYGLDPKKIKLGIAPSLEPEHHEIKPEDFHRVIENPEEWQPYVVRSIENNSYYPDVRSYVADQYIMAGIPPENIELYLNGTYESSGQDKGFSYRRSRHEGTPPYCFGIAVQIQE